MSSSVNERLDIYPKRDRLALRLTKHLKTGIANCSVPSNSLLLDPVIKALWLEILNSTYPNAINDGCPEATPDMWHTGFSVTLKAVGATTKLFPFARHVAANKGLVYPELNQVADKFVKGIVTPGGIMDYETLFELAVKNIVHVWKGIDAALNGENYSFVETLEDWNLDTGRSVAINKYVFWSN